MKVLTFFLGAASAKLAEIAKSKQSKDEPSAKKADAPSEAKPAPDPSSADLQKVRDDLGAYGTAIGVGSTLVVGASTYTTLDSLFPMPNNLWWIAVAIVFSAAIVGSVRLTRLFFVAKRRILINTMEFGTDRLPPVPDEKGGLSRAEYKIVERRFEEFAAEEGVPDVVVAEARMERLARVASVAEALDQADVAKSARAESQRLNAGLDAAIGQAALLVIEQRSAAVYRGWRTIAWALLAALGVAGIFLVADWSKGERDYLDTWVTCHKDLKDKDLPDVREQVCVRLLRPPPSTSPSGSNGSPSATGGADSDAAESTPTPNPVDAMNECAAARPAPSPARTVSKDLWERAVAACANLPPQPAATGSK